MSQTLSCLSQLGSWLRLDAVIANASAHAPLEAGKLASVEEPDQLQTDDPVEHVDDEDDVAAWAEAVGAAPNPPAAPRRESAILQMPADVLLLISDYLDTPAALSLSLTCRCARALCHRPGFAKLAPRDKREVLQLLERDPLMPGVFYCHACNILHPFGQDWGPHSPAEEPAPRDAAAAVFHCGRRDRFAPNWNAYDLGYHHARLVVNRHLYGPAHGIPLANICVDQALARDGAHPSRIRASTRARVLGGELFLRRDYAFDVPDRPDAVDAFRRCTGARDFRVCEHTSFFSNSSVYRQHIPEIQRRPPAPAPDAASAAPQPPSGFVPCAAAPGSCGLCLMDFDVSIAAPDAGRGVWAFAIRAYHRLGACRSPDDWPWARFSEASRPHLFFPNRPNRRGSAEHPGAVRRRWVEAEEAEREEAPVGGEAEEQAVPVSEGPGGEGEAGLPRIPPWLWTQASAPVM